jgi:peptide/nickel transport system substrate-binding protein
MKSRIENRRTILKAMAAAPAVLVLSPQFVAAQDAGEPVTGGDLIFARREDNTTMDPVVAVETETIYVLNHIFETLFATSADGKTVEPWLATGHELSEDQLTWTIQLRSGVTFSDGTPLTSADVKFSVERARDNSPFGFLLSAIETIDTPDDETVVITTAFPWSPLLADLSVWAAAIVPKDFGGSDEEEFFNNPVGTGPFILDSWERGSQLTVVRNDNYWQEGKPYLNSVTWTQVPDANTRVLQLQGGQAHIASDLPFNTMQTLTSMPGIRAEAFPGTTVFYIMFNTTKEPFDDVHLRRAIAHALNKEAMAQAVLFGYGEGACSIIAPTVAFYDAETPCLTYDLEAAKAELAQSSVPDGTAIEFLVGDNPTNTAIAEIIQGQLAPLGIDVTLRLIDEGQFYETLSSLDYEIGYAGWTMDIPDPDEQIAFMLDPELGGGDSYSTSYDNPDMVKLVRDAQKEFDQAARQEIYSEIQALHAAEVPHIPLVFQQTTFAWTDDVQGFHVNPVGNRHLEDIWLKEG